MWLSVCIRVCVCVCVCVHGREAAVIASGCTPLYVSDLGLMKLKAWQLWGASAEPQSDGHLILLPCPRGAHTHLRTRPAVCTVMRCPRVPALQKVMPHMLWMPSGRSAWLPQQPIVQPQTGDRTGSEADQINVFGKFKCQVFFVFVYMHTFTSSPMWEVELILVANCGLSLLWQQTDCTVETRTPGEKQITYM